MAVCHFKSSLLRRISSSSHLSTSNFHFSTLNSHLSILNSHFSTLNSHLSILNSRSFSAATPALAGIKNFFRNKDESKEIQVEPTSAELARAEIMRSKNMLGSYEKAALQSIIDTGLGKMAIAYKPPSNAREKLQEIYAKVFDGEENKNVADLLQVLFTDRVRKFQFLTACEETFAYSVPNSLLHQMKTVGDVFDYYQQPVAGTNGLTQYQQMDDLPPNLHINYQPFRFDADNDPIYGGITAFPHSHKFVTGLKYRKMYKSVRAETNWPKVLDCKPFRRNQCFLL